MVGLTQLWLPILLSAVFVFVASSIIHMMLGYHKHDYKGVPEEEKFRAAVGPLNLAPGTYHVPHCSDHKAMKAPEYQEKLKQGPIALITVFPNGAPNMGKYLGCWFVYLLAVSVFAAYLASRTLQSGEPYLHVFRITGTVAFCAYALGHTHNSVWRGESWATAFRFYFDGLVYACLTAGTFGWLWPR